MIAYFSALPQEHSKIIEILDNFRQVEPAPFWLAEGQFCGQPLLLARGGMGRGAVESAFRFIQSAYPVQAVVFLGFAGALQPGLAGGELLLCDTFIFHPGNDPHPAAEEAAPVARAASALHRQASQLLHAAGLAFRTGSSLTLRLPVRTPAMRRALAAGSGALIAEMEDYWLASLVTAAGLPYLAVRAVSDTLTDRLPELERFLDPQGNLQRGRLAGHLLTHPADLVASAHLAPRMFQAQASLLAFFRAFAPGARQFVSGGEALAAASSLGETPPTDPSAISPRQPGASPASGSRRMETPDLAEAILRARQALLRVQHPPGYWLGELEADASVTAGYIPLMTFMTGQVEGERRRKVVHSVLARQNAEGSWPVFHGGPGDLNVSLQVYFALKLAGLPADHPALEAARRFIQSQGGPARAGVFTRIWLALFGQFDWGSVPALPPEIIFLPNWFYFNIYEFASWSRETIMALIVVLTLKPVCEIPPGAGIAELYLEPPGQRRYPLGRSQKLWSWRSFFLLADRLFKLYEKMPFKPGRQKALRRVADWILEHQESDGSWGGIMLPWIYSLYALKSLGYPPDHPVMVRGMQGLEAFIVDEEAPPGSAQEAGAGGRFLLQPAVSPVWDTAWTVIALRESGLPADHPALQRAATWLLEKEIRHAGDWRIKNPHTPPGGWAFEFVNDWYPDLDDSAVVPRALLRVALSPEGEAAKTQAIARALRWVLDMQSRDGGWGAFDRDNDRRFLEHVPFADFMSPLDPTCPDVTAHVVEFLAEVQPGAPARQRGLDYLFARQEPDGAWYGRWGVNTLYGVGLSLAALAAAGIPPEHPAVRKGLAWLVRCQNADGGWGETCQSYVDPAWRGRGPSTASQTAWALFGLLSQGQAGSPAAERGLAYLLDHQQPDGTWLEPEFTGGGFPGVFYLHYDLYRLYFPLLALALARNASHGRVEASVSQPISEKERSHDGYHYD